MTKELTGKVAIVTGASQGIGAGLVDGFLAKGYRVVANSRSIKPSTKADLVTVAGDIADPEVAKLITTDFVALKIDTEAGKRSTEIASKYNVQSLPTIAFVSPSGRPIDRVNGFQGPGPFPGTLQTVKAKAAKVIAWETALDKDGQDPFALFQLGMHMFEQEAYAESRDLLRRATDADTRRPVADRKQARMLIGIIQRYDNNLREAETVLKEGLALEPATEFDPKMLYILGRVYAAWNKTPEARLTLTRVVNEYPASSVAQKAKETLLALGQR